MCFISFKFKVMTLFCLTVYQYENELIAIKNRSITINTWFMNIILKQWFKKLYVLFI
jgi:hypothetical protein